MLFRVSGTRRGLYPWEPDEVVAAHYTSIVPSVADSARQDTEGNERDQGCPARFDARPIRVHLE